MQLKKEVVEEIGAAEAARLIEGRGEGGCLLLDVRQPEEYARSHLPGATLIPLAELEGRAPGLGHEGPVITYCRSGNRSRAAAHLLRRLGFEEVYSMSGGIMGWHRPVARGWPRVHLFTGAEDLTTALNLVFFMERGSQAFYERASGEARSPGVAGLLSGLAGAEAGHMRLVYERLAAARQEMPSFEEFRELADSDLMEGALEPAEYLPRLGEMVLADERHALEEAMELEAMSLDLYRSLAAQAADGGVRSALLEMSGQEKEHLARLAAKLGELARQPATH